MIFTTTHAITKTLIMSSGVDHRGFEDLTEITFKIPKSGLNVLDYLASSLETSRQNILNEILSSEIRNSYFDFTNQFKMNKLDHENHFKRVFSGDLKKEQDNA